MVLKCGYKQSDLGVIPEDWGVSALGPLTTKVGSGVTPRGGEKVYKSEGRPFLRSQNVGWGELLLDDIAFIDEETHSTFLSTELKEKDVLLNITGASIGRSAVADTRLVGGNVNQHVCIIRADMVQLYPQFLNLFLLSELGQKQIDSFQAGGNRQGLNFGQIKSFLLLLPNLSEQRAIAAALSDMDALLASLDALIAKKRLIQQGAMQELLTGKRRLPGFSGEWEVKKLGEIGNCLRGVSYKADTDLSSSDSLNTIRLLRSNNVQDHRVIRDEMQFVNSTKVACHQIMKRDDILICMANGSKELVGKAGRFLFNDGYQYTFGAFMGCFRINSSGVFSGYIPYLFQTDKYRAYLKIMLAGTSINNLTPSTIEGFEVLIPPKDEQEAIAYLLSDFDDEIVSLEQQREKTHQIKQGMMQELLTGRTRLI